MKQSRAYEVHSGHLARGGVMRWTGVGIGNLSHDFGAVVHFQKECFVVLAFLELRGVDTFREEL